MSRRFLPCQAPGHAAMAPSRMVRAGSGTRDSSLTVCATPRPWHPGQAPAAVFGENASESSCSGAGRVGARPGKQHPERVGQRGHRANGGTAAGCAAALLKRDGGRQPGDHLHLGIVALLDEAARVRGDGFKVAALGFGVDGAEGERGLARARDARERHNGVARHIHVHVPQVVLPRAPDPDEAVRQMAGSGKGKIVSLLRVPH